MESNAESASAKRPPVGALLYPLTKTFMIYGANTDVGKTVVSTLLCRAVEGSSDTVDYLKPVSTGPVAESDEMSSTLALPPVYITRLCSSNSGRYVRTHANCVTKTLYEWDEAVSPHLAARDSSQPCPSDDEVLRRIVEVANSSDERQRRDSPEKEGWLFVETAGGILSPGPSGTPQADMYRPLRMPVILVGDSKLGGISQTISAFESLRIRGYDVSAVVVIDFHPEYQNSEFLAQYFLERHSVRVFKIPPPPSSNKKTYDEEIEAYYELVEKDADSKDHPLHQLVEKLRSDHETRNEKLGEMWADTHKQIWYPFTQHKTFDLSEKVLVIDSALDDHFQTAVFQGDHFQNVPLQENDQLGKKLVRSEPGGSLKSSFDASASWWTQGLGHGNPSLALEAAYASGRYGHVIFPEAIHEPAYNLAASLLKHIGNPRLSRVFFSDNGSTGVEVAVKMALRAARLRYKWPAGNMPFILGLRDSYHGDTIGAMDCSPPSAFNQQIPWYTPRGVWLEYPELFCRGGYWYIHIPRTIEPRQQNIGTHTGISTTRGPFKSLDALFGPDRRGHEYDKTLYEAYIRKVIVLHLQKGHSFCALMLEPVVLGAGGMHLVDPLFQRTLVEVVRGNSFVPHPFDDKKDDRQGPGERTWSGLPVIFDEVFTGMFRLGRLTASSFLGVHPDISVHAKLLTGGLLPLCVTLASESIFDAFSGSEKTDALLHGHSYTAHPIGCHVADVSLCKMMVMNEGGDWAWARGDKPDPGKTWSFWSSSFVSEASAAHNVDAVWALGCVMAMRLKGQPGMTSGYASELAQGFQSGLRYMCTEECERGWNIHIRTLGDVLYVMTSLTTTQETMRRVESRLLNHLIYRKVLGGGKTQ